MKKILFSFLACLLISCSKDPTIINERSFYIGNWNIEDSFIVESQIEETLQFNRPLTLNIKEDGTAEEKNLISCTIRELDWYYQDNPDQIIFLRYLTGSNTFTEVFDVVEVVNADSIIMISTYIQETSDDTLFFENTRTLSR